MWCKFWKTRWTREQQDRLKEGGDNFFPIFFFSKCFFSFFSKVKKTWSRGSYWRCVGAEDGEKMAREYRLQLFTPSKPIGSWNLSPWPQPSWRSPSCTAPSSWRPARRTGGTSWTHWSCWQERCAPVRMLRWDKLVWRSVKYKHVGIVLELAKLTKKVWRKV